MTVTGPAAASRVGGVRPPIRPADEDLIGFLFHEARLLDERRYVEWVGLYADDGLYWMPCDGPGGNPAARVTIVYDDVEALRSRVGRLETGKQYAQDPPSRMSRAVSNAYLDDSDRNDQHEVTVHSTLIAVEARRHHTKRIYGAHVVHVLRRMDDGLAIVQKKVELVDNDQYFENLTFLL